MRQKDAAMSIRTFELSDEADVVALWRETGLTVPWNDPHKDIRRKLEACPDLFLVGIDKDKVVATMMVGYDGHRGSINYLAVAPHLQGQGIGRQMVQEAERRLKAMGCPKLNLMVRTSNKAVVEFYRQLGYAVDEVLCLGKRLVIDEALPPEE